MGGGHGLRRKATNRNNEQAKTALGTRFRKALRENRTDATGRGTATYSVPQFADLDTLEGAAFATVLDETGQPVNRPATFEVQTLSHDVQPSETA